MRKLFTIGLLSLSALTFAQKKKLSKAQLFDKYKNSISQKMGASDDKKLMQKDFDFYYCLITNYNYDISTDAKFMTEKEFLKKFGNTEYSTIEQNDYILYLNTIAPYQKRWEFADNHKKCIKNPEEWKW